MNFHKFLIYNFVLFFVQDECEKQNKDTSYIQLVEYNAQDTDNSLSFLIYRKGDDVPPFGECHLYDGQPPSVVLYDHVIITPHPSPYRFVRKNDRWFVLDTNYNEIESSKDLEYLKNKYL